LLEINKGILNKTLIGSNVPVPPFPKVSIAVSTNYSSTVLELIEIVVESLLQTTFNVYSGVKILVAPYAEIFR
jgi:hypothetical protein